MSIGRRLVYSAGFGVVWGIILTIVGIFVLSRIFGAYYGTDGFLCHTIASGMECYYVPMEIIMRKVFTCLMVLFFALMCMAFVALSIIHL